jgi:lipopolysaccharide/colanic/teichoic acid biosynthesis glycosyltransferase
VAKETRETDIAPSHGLLVEEARLKSVCSKVDIIILVLPEIAQELLSKTLGKSLLQKRRVITVPDIQDFSSPWLTPVDFGGTLGLEVRQRISRDDRQFFKRILDIGIILVLAPIWLPTSVICAFLVLADSRGGIIFRQTRIGQDGRPMRILKFRTMIDNADRKLDNIINHDKYRSEWEKNYKLKDDPRITRVGRLLRKFSLDELPQIWNVLRGEMSIIGPRPIVIEEVKHSVSRLPIFNQNQIKN